MANKTKWTPSKKAEFLKCLAEEGSAKAAAEMIGLSRSQAYVLRDLDEQFAKEWTEAEKDAFDTLEREGRRRAMEKSDTLLIFYLKAHSEKYRMADRMEITGKDGAALPTASEIAFEIAKLQKLVKPAVIVDAESTPQLGDGKQ